MVEVGECKVPAALSSAAEVRHNVADDLAARGMPTALVEDVVLVASELVANAVRHGSALPSGSVLVRWDVDDSGVGLRVVDGGAAGSPELRRPEPDAPSGRGLAIVATLADRWGVDTNSGGTTVWAHLHLP